MQTPDLVRAIIEELPIVMEAPVTFFTLLIVLVLLAGAVISWGFRMKYEGAEKMLKTENQSLRDQLAREPQDQEDAAEEPEPSDFPEEVVQRAWETAARAVDLAGEAIAKKDQAITEVERARQIAKAATQLALFFERLYLERHLIPGTVAVLSWVESAGQATIGEYHDAWGDNIRELSERETRLAVLERHLLVEIDGQTISATTKGRNYLQTQTAVESWIITLLLPPQR